MAPDLLSRIRREIDERLSELRPLLAERERLLVAADALTVTDRVDSPDAAVTAVAPKRGRRGARPVVTRRGSAAGAIKLAASDQGEVEAEGNATNGSAGRREAVDARRPVAPRHTVTKPKLERAARGAARDAILGALEHGSHTVSELAVVTAMTGPSISSNLRRLVTDGVVVKTEREGKAAWALGDASV
jgi:hypothetical protein